MERSTTNLLGKGWVNDHRLGPPLRGERPVSDNTRATWTGPLGASDETVEESGRFETNSGAIAQLVEHFHGMEGVRGSIPLSSTP